MSIAEKRVAVRYAKDDKLKWNAKRLLDRKKIYYDRVTLLATLPLEVIETLKTKYQCTIFEVSTNSTTTDLFKAACKDFIALFLAFAQNPTKANFKRLLLDMDRTNMDKVMEILDHE
jgi:hypothetical protein